MVTFEVEHIIPQSLAGETKFENLCLACPSYNRHKFNRTMGLTVDGIESRLFHPHQDNWSDHFDWSVSGTLIVGLTDSARATINLLLMNRSQLI